MIVVMCICTHVSLCVCVRACVCVTVYKHFAGRCVYTGTHAVPHLLWTVGPWSRTVDSVSCESVTTIDGVGGHALLRYGCFDKFVCAWSCGL